MVIHHPFVIQRKYNMLIGKSFFSLSWHTPNDLQARNIEHLHHYSNNEHRTFLWNLVGGSSTKREKDQDILLTFLTNNANDYHFKTMLLDLKRIWILPPSVVNKIIPWKLLITILDLYLWYNYFHGLMVSTWLHLFNSHILSILKNS